MKYTLTDAVELLNSLVEKCKEVQKEQGILETEREKAKTAQTHLDSAKDVLESWSKVLWEDVKLSSDLNKLYASGRAYDSLGLLTNDNFVHWATDFNSGVMEFRKTLKNGRSDKPRMGVRDIIGTILIVVFLAAIIGVSLWSYLVLPKSERSAYNLITMAVGVLDFICGVSFFAYERTSDKNKALTTNDDNVPSERTYSKGQKIPAYFWAVGAFVLSMVALAIMLILVFELFQIQYEDAHTMWAASCILSIMSVIFVGIGVFFQKRGNGVRIFVLMAAVVCVGSIVLQHYFKPVEARNDIVEYVANEDGTYQAVIVPQQDFTDYVIAASYDGKLITSIGRKDPEKPLYIKSLDIGANITTIGDEAFAHSRGLTRLKIPENVTRIGQRAFYDSTNLQDVVISGNLQQVDTAIFGNCPKLATVWWNIVNQQIKFKELFAGCDNINTVILDVNTQSIRDEMFDNCKSIERVVIRENVSTIGANAFRNCDNLQQIFFSGNETQWQQIVATKGEGNDVLDSAELFYYSKTEPQHNNEETGYVGHGNYWHFSDDNGYDLPTEWEFVVPTYSITFIADGRMVKNVSYRHNQTTIGEEPAVPIKKGYTGKWEEYTLNNSDIVVNAIYTAKTYTLNFDYNGANGNIGADSLVVTYGKSVGELPNPTKTYGRFMGWYLNSNLIEETTVWSIDDGNSYVLTAKFVGTYFYDGLGTEEQPFLIKTAEHFSNISLFPSAYYRLVSDIDMSKNIGTTIRSFSGNLDGKEYSIYNLSICEDGADSTECGIIGTNNGTVCNLNLRNCYFTLSPKFINKSMTNYCGAIAGVNNGTIENCHIFESYVISNSSDIADKFMALYKEDPREIIRGSANWKIWITQSFYTSISKWSAQPMSVYAGGVVGLNSGKIIKCSFGGKVDANLYNMNCICNDKKAGTNGKGQTNCFSGGLAGQNEGTISQSEANAQVRAWIELSNNGEGLGWVGDMYVWGVCYACGLVGKNVNGTVDGKSNCTQQASYRIYAPQYVFLSGADYNSSSKGHADNLTIGTSDTYK